MTGSTDTRLIDLRHLGHERVIGAWRVGDVIVDPGPSTGLGVLLGEIEQDPPRALALTHIHLDHAGAAGSLVQRFPDLEVWVHERGAPHLVDPSRLLASAGRLYGEDMQRLWGEVLAVPAERIVTLAGGERRDGFRVAYTPGHASHHVSYLHEDSGRAFVGDVAGVRIGGGYALPPTPPPDVDLDAWRRSLDLVAEWQPSHLGITHFGDLDDVDEHLAALREHLGEFERLVRDNDEDAFAAIVRAQVRESVDAETARAYEQAMPPGQSWQGLVRYLRQRDEHQEGS